MNLSNLNIPFTLFFQWRTNTCQIPALVTKLRYVKHDNDVVQVRVMGTRRNNRQTVVMLDTLSQVRRRVDVGIHMCSAGESPLRQEGHNYIFWDKVNDTAALHEWRITLANGTNETAMWLETRDGTQSKMPKKIAFTNRGWQTIPYIMRNEHLLIHRPVGAYRGFSRGNFVRINPSSAAYNDRDGWYDKDKHGYISTDSRDILHDITTTFTYDGRVYPISMAVFNEVNMVKLRSFTRKLTDRVLSEELTIEQAVVAMQHSLLNDRMATVTPSNYIPRGNQTVPSERLWRGLYTSKYVKLNADKSRILRAFANQMRLRKGSIVSDISCSYCGEAIYSWENCETAEIKARGNSEVDTRYYCNEDHVLRDSTVVQEVSKPDKYSYHTDVLGYFPMGETKHKAPNGDGRRVGIELETYHNPSDATVLAKSVVGGTIHKKMKDKGVKDGIEWDNDTYAKFGAIPTRDGSLCEANGVEWVFRPSGLQGMEQDIDQFMQTAGQFIEYDAGEADSDSSRTYGLHVHVTATDTMLSRITRIRIAVVANRLSRFFHVIGGRGYSNYTRLTGTASILRMDMVERARRNMVATVEGFQPKYQWIKFTKPDQMMGDTAYNTTRDQVRRGRTLPTRRYTLDRSCQDALSNAINDELFNRYNMANIAPNKPTIEFRHARSYVSKEYIMLNVELSQAVAIFGAYEIMSVRQATFKDTPELFKDWVMKNKREYPRLAEWILINGSLDMRTRVSKRHENVSKKYGG